MHKLHYLSVLVLSLTNLACTEQQNNPPSKATTVAPAGSESQIREPVIDRAIDTPTNAAQKDTAIISPQAVKEQLPVELELAKKSGCLACHKVESKLVGPAWRDVAKRYAGDNAARQKLIIKVSKGGKGNWIEVTGGAAMPPYSPRVSDENIAKLVDFVLSLK